jgi:hypothetical protein
LNQVDDNKTACSQSATACEGCRRDVCRWVAILNQGREPNLYLDDHHKRRSHRDEDAIVALSLLNAIQ